MEVIKGVYTHAVLTCRKINTSLAHAAVLYHSVINISRIAFHFLRLPHINNKVGNFITIYQLSHYSSTGISQLANTQSLPNSLQNFGR